MHQIEAEFTFAAAHRLPRYNGKCFNLHGHNYRMQVVLRGEPDSYTGIFVDFGDVEKAVQEHVLAKVDHANLNDFIENPTAEHIATWMWASHTGTGGEGVRGRSSRRVHARSGGGAAQLVGPRPAQGRAGDRLADRFPLDVSAPPSPLQRDGGGGVRGRPVVGWLWKDCRSN